MIFTINMDVDIMTSVDNPLLCANPSDSFESCQFLDTEYSSCSLFDTKLIENNKLENQRCDACRKVTGDL